MKLISGLFLFSLTGCVTTFEIRHPIPCSTLVPEETKQATPGADIPPVDGNENWFPYGVAQTKQLGKANARFDAATGIIQKCEERDRAIEVKVKRNLKPLNKK